MPSTPNDARHASRRRSARVRGLAVGAIALLASCRGATDVPPTVVARIFVGPTPVAILKGSTRRLEASMRDPEGTAVVGRVEWTTSAPAIATVSPDGVVTAVGYGTVMVRATAGEVVGSAEVVVTGTPLTAAYSVRELLPALPATESSPQMNDSGHVLVTSTRLLYRDGVGSPVPGCDVPIALNNLTHLLCAVSGIAASAPIAQKHVIWRRGVTTPLAARDSFAAESSVAMALNDSDAVAGWVVGPAFTNPNCPRSSIARCLVVWRAGQPTIPGLMLSPRSGTTHLTNHFDIVVQDVIEIPDAIARGEHFIFNLSSGQKRQVPDFVRAINDQAWTAIDRIDLVRVRSGGVVSQAMTVRADTTITFGSGAANGIDNAGAVVGTLYVGPFLWISGGVSLLGQAATDPAWTITKAWRINNRGQILAQANNTDGRQGRWVVMTPMPR